MLCKLHKGEKNQSDITVPVDILKFKKRKQFLKNKQTMDSRIQDIFPLTNKSMINRINIHTAKRCTIFGGQELAMKKEKGL